MKISSATLLLFMSILPAIAPAAELRVPEDHPDIQTAINAAVAGDVISVAPGTYRLSSPLNFSGKNVAVVGRLGREQTILQATGSNSLALLVGIEGPAGRLEGFTFRDGVPEFVERGGCLSVQQGSPVIANNRFENCRAIEGEARSSGGALKVISNARPEIRANEFIGNRSFSQGGAVHIIEAGGRVINNVFRNNRVSGQPESGGGGLKVTFSTGEPVEIRGNVFENNEASFAGGAISVFGGDADIVDNEIRSNGPSRFGGGIHLETQSDSGGDRRLRVLDNVFEGNMAMDTVVVDIHPNNDGVSGGAMHVNLGPQGAVTDSTIEIRGNTFTSNESTDSRCVDDHADFSCGVGGAIEFLNALARPQSVVENTFEDNRADRYAAANFDKVQLVFERNLVRRNRAGRSHPGIGCVTNGNATSTVCIVERNRFIDNGFGPDSFGVAELNNAGAVNIRRHRARIINNLFAGNRGHFATVFIKHDDGGLEDRLSRVEHNTFVDNDRKKPWFGTLGILGQAIIRNNLFVGDWRAFRLDNADSRSSVVANNITDTIDSVARFDTDDPDSSVTFSSVAALNSHPLASQNTARGPGFFDVASGDYSLTGSSELIDSVACVADIRADLRGVLRPVGDACEPGALENDMDRIFKARFEQR